MLYMATFTINISPMSAYIYQTWILWDIADLNIYCRLLQILQYNGTAVHVFPHWAALAAGPIADRCSEDVLPGDQDLRCSQRDTGIGNNDGAVNAYYMILHVQYNMYINVLHISRISIPCSSCKKLETSAGNLQLAPRFQESMAVLKPGISRAETQKYRK